MKETLGKRIAYHRKQIGLTQDALAEQLGITAQAVSKWENDISCPDIATLPRLADIFGITTDELLGREKPQVHEAEVVDDMASEDDADDADDAEDRAVIRWRRRKFDGIAFAILMLWVGAWMLINRALSWDISFWNILWPSGLLWIGIRGLCKRFGAFPLGCTLFGAYFMLDQMPFWTIEIAGEMVFPILIVLLGLGLLIDALCKPKKAKKKPKKKEPAFGVTVNGEPQMFYTEDGESFDCSVTKGSDSRTVTLNRLKSGDVSCVFGDVNLDLSGCAEVAEDALIEVNCVSGNVVLKVPERYRMEPEVTRVFHNYIVEGCPAPDAQPIRLEANVLIGKLTVHYILENE